MGEGVYKVGNTVLRLRSRGVAFFALLVLLASGCGGDDSDDNGTTVIDGQDSGSDPEGSVDSGNGEPEIDGGSGGPGADAGTAGDAGSDGGEPDSGELSGCSAGECDLLQADSCGEDSACRFLLREQGNVPEAQCIGAGQGAEGDDCFGNSDCGPGLDCTVECDPEARDCTARANAGRCRAYCCSVNKTAGCPDGQACLIELLDLNDESTGVGLCDICDGCDPLVENDCGNRGGCYPIPDENTGSISSCFLCLGRTEDLEEGAPCGSAAECRPGLGCLNVGVQTNTCTRFCDLASGAAGCDSGDECQDLLGAASRDGSLGICVSG